MQAMLDGNERRDCESRGARPTRAACTNLGVSVGRGQVSKTFVRGIVTLHPCHFDVGD